ncbi:hypothetical protein HYT02_00555 [Candidatus Gottesmanbacteria bacterium]|nr:hypothetical protein [Candidatus Gottesmanbacteria bacterium]
MIKYKIVGFFNILFGLILFFVPLTYLLLVIPKINELYADFGTKPNLLPIYATGSVPLFIGLLTIFIGSKLFSSQAKIREKYFLYVLISLILWIIGGLIVGFLTLSIPFTLYNLTSQF